MPPRVRRVARAHRALNPRAPRSRRRRPPRATPSHSPSPRFFTSHPRSPRFFARAGSRRATASPSSSQTRRYTRWRSTPSPPPGAAAVNCDGRLAPELGERLDDAGVVALVADDRHERAIDAALGDRGDDVMALWAPAAPFERRRLVRRNRRILRLPPRRPRASPRAASETRSVWSSTRTPTSSSNDRIPEVQTPRERRRRLDRRGRPPNPPTRSPRGSSR